MTPLTNKTAEDLEYILRTATDAATPLDELALIRTALRAYIEGRPAADAVAWAAAQLSTSLSKFVHP